MKEGERIPQCFCIRQVCLCVLPLFLSFSIPFFFLLRLCECLFSSHVCRILHECASERERERRRRE